MSLNYHLLVKNPKAAPITLDIFDAERYASAVIVQQLIGNLVYYSNQGRYEPRIAETWERKSPNLWIFTLKQNYKCENGEIITAQKFKESLDRIIFIFSKKSRLPVFSKLVGYDHFLQNGNNLNGIIAINNQIEFHFVEPIKTGLLEMLSYASFGYISRDNFKDNFEWKDPSKFISSGPYKAKSILIGEKYVLEKRLDWPSENNKSPQEVTFTTNLNSTSNGPTIVDSFSLLESIPNGLNLYPLVPEYLNAIVVGNFDGGYFKSVKNRLFFKSLIEKNRIHFPSVWHNHVQSSSFFSSQPSNHENLSYKVEFPVTPPLKPLIIEGTEPVPETAKWFSWQILKTCLDEVKWPYKFAGNATNWSQSGDSNYDIRLVGPSVGGGFEVWSVNVNFCATLGLNLPDPSGRICNILTDYENNEVSDDDVRNHFFKIIDEDAAIIPISHYGLNWYISNEVNRDSISPLISVIRLDDLILE